MRVKKLWMLAMIGVLSFSLLTGCGKKEEQKEPEKQQEVVEPEKEEKPEEVKPVEEAKPEEQVQLVTIYIPNDNADGFVREEVEGTSIDEHWVLQQLIEKKVVPDDVQILSCKKEEVNGTASLNVDFNGAFQTYLQTMGTAGEYVTLGSVVNSFLSVYECDQVKITVEGQMLMTGHAEYPDYMEKYE